MGIVFLVGQFQGHRQVGPGRGIFSGIQTFFFGFPAIHGHHLEQVPFVEVEVGIHGIMADDRCQQRRFFFTDQVADVDIIAADPAGNRGGDLGVFHFQLRPVDLGLGPQDSGPGDFAFPAPFDHIGIRSRSLLEDPLRAAKLGFRPFELGPGAFQLGPGGIQFGLVFPGINHKQQRIFFDPGAGGKVHALQKSGHPGAHFDFFHRVGGAGKLQIVDDLLLQGLGNGHLRRRGCNIFIALVTGSKCPEGRKNN